MTFLPEHDPYAPPRAPIGTIGTTANLLGGDRPPADHIDGSPLLTIWTEPRSTIRTILDTRPTYGVLPLAAVSGFGNGLAQVFGLKATVDYPILTMVGVAAIVGPIFGIIGLYIAAAIFQTTGRWLKGRGTAQDVRAAVAWSGVINYPTMLMMVGMYLAFGKEFFGPQALASPSPTYLAYLAAGFLFGIWGVFVFCKSVGEAHLFSAWKAFGASAIALLGFVAIMVVLGITLAILAAVLKPT